MGKGIWISARAINECKNLTQAMVFSIIEKKKHLSFEQMRKSLKISDDRLSSAILALEDQGKIEATAMGWKETEI